MTIIKFERPDIVENQNGTTGNEWDSVAESEYNGGADAVVNRESELSDGGRGLPSSSEDFVLEVEEIQQARPATDEEMAEYDRENAEGYRRWEELVERSERTKRIGNKTIQVALTIAKTASGFMGPVGKVFGAATDVAKTAVGDKDIVVTW